MTFFHRTKTSHPKFKWNYKRSQITKAILRKRKRKKKKAGHVVLSDFRLYHKATVAETVWYCHQNRNINQWTRVESPEINLYTYDQLIYDKREKNRQWRKKSLQ